MMFSQLCRARLRSKIGHHADAIPRSGVDPDWSDKERCQLEHCTFCDYKGDGRLNSSTTQCDQDTECPPNNDTTVTENPAYGLSSKNWLETKDLEDGSCETSEMVNMESQEQNSNCDKPCGSLISNAASQRDRRCDATTIPKMNPVNFQSQFQLNKMELRSKLSEDANMVSGNEILSSDLQKQGKLAWSALRPRQMSGDILKSCDKTFNMIEHSTSDKNTQADSQDPSYVLKTKKNLKDRSFPLSLMRPIVRIGDKRPDTLSQQHAKNDLSRQRPVHRNAREKFQHPTANKTTKNSSTNDILGMNNPLSEIAQIKTEESVQEWLARIGESTNSTWTEESEEKGAKPEIPQRTAWGSLNSPDDEKDNSQGRSQNCRTDTKDMHRKAHNLTDVSGLEGLGFDALTPKTDELDTTNVLCNASKASPANVPMVVMQCSRLHSHIGCKPPYQQTSLPMGTLVTALYQESDWLYVQTPHGVEGFVSASNCVPIGTVNEPAHTSRRPWEPCDFPIRITLRKQLEFGRQQGAYISAKLPENNGKQAPPYVSTVKMKTNFYSDRYFSHTFKSKDSIKTAKTVTDILRSSPETKVSNQ